MSSHENLTLALGALFAELDHYGSPLPPAVHERHVEATQRAIERLRAEESRPDARASAVLERRILQEVARVLEGEEDAAPWMPHYDASEEYWGAIAYARSGLDIEQCEDWQPPRWAWHFGDEPTLRLSWVTGEGWWLDVYRTETGEVVRVRSEPRIGWESGVSSVLGLLEDWRARVAEKRARAVERAEWPEES